MENPTYKVACHGVGNFEKKGMTEHAASLAALRAAITLRNGKVVANVQQKVHFDDTELRAWLRPRSARSQACTSTKDRTAGWPVGTSKKRRGRTNATFQ